MGVKCFWTERTSEVARWLRRYRHRTNDACPAMQDGFSYHQALTRIENAPGDFDSRGYLQAAPDWSRLDPRWPAACACGYRFAHDDAWQVFQEVVYIRPDTGERFEEGLRKMPPGAMWNAYWMTHCKGSDGMALAVICPDGREWLIDGRANNCTMPQDNAHRCWVRHGTPPNITVDKDGLTCGAGGGSIQTPGYHGFLRNGEFEP